MAAVSIFSKNLGKPVFAMAIWCLAGAMLVTYGPKHFTNMSGVASSKTLTERQATFYKTAKDVASVQTSEGKLSPSSETLSPRRSADASSEPITSSTSLVFGGLAALTFLSVTTTTFSMLRNVDARVRSAAPVSAKVKYVAPVQAVAPAAPIARTGKVSIVSTGDQVLLTSPEGAQSDWVFNKGSAFKALAEQLGTH